MNLNYGYSGNNRQSHLNFESENNTYSIMDLEREYDRTIFSKTDSTKHARIFLISLIALGIMSNSFYTSLEKEDFNKFDAINHIIIDQKANTNANITNESWIDDFIINVKTLHTPKDLFPYYAKINNLMIEKKFEEYDEILRKVEIKELNETLIIALLRLSFVWKDNISSWNQFLKESSFELEHRGHKSKKLLMGLI